MLLSSMVNLVANNSLLDAKGFGLNLRGEKVALLQFSVADISETYINWLNDPEVVKFSNQRFFVHDYQSCLCYLRSFIGTENLFISIKKLSDGCPIGTLSAYVSENHGTVDVGIMIGDKSAWGMGYGQDAWDVLTNFFLIGNKARKLTAGTLACNYGMIKILERSDMTLEAVRKAQELVNGHPVDILLYSKFSK